MAKMGLFFCYVALLQKGVDKYFYNLSIFHKPFKQSNFYFNNTNNYIILRPKFYLLYYYRTFSLWLLKL